MLEFVILQQQQQQQLISKSAGQACVRNCGE
jgi:hypothetical protein